MTLSSSSGLIGNSPSVFHCQTVPQIVRLFVQAVALIGEYNDWNPEDSHWAQRNEFGVWQLFLPDKADGTPALKHK